AMKMEMAREQQELREKQWLLALLIISFILVGVLSVFAISKMRSNRTLKEKNQIIDQSLKDKELLIREIQHRVKNNLQIISSLLKLQVRSTNDDEAKSALRKGQERIDSIALIYKNLYQSDKITGVQTKQYIEQLSRSLLRSLPLISLTTDVEDLILDVDVLVPIGLIVNELISNAIQYGFADDEMGHIMISLKRDGNDIALIVEDDGIGLSQMEMEHRNKSGFKLIRAYLQKLNGTIHIRSSQGTIVHCQFKAVADLAA
ncbi:MAG: sensor histidine kinase, partial [Flavobacteriaceae bacterium]